MRSFLRLFQCHYRRYDTTTCSDNHGVCSRDGDTIAIHHPPAPPPPPLLFPPPPPPATTRISQVSEPLSTTKASRCQRAGMCGWFCAGVRDRSARPLAGSREAHGRVAPCNPVGIGRGIPVIIGRCRRKSVHGRGDRPDAQHAEVHHVIPARKPSARGPSCPNTASPSPARSRSRSDSRSMSRCCTSPPLPGCC